MPEILFRGKRVDNGEWISGSILSFDDGGKVILPSTAKVFKEHGTTTICCNECYDVYPETVGQYTGLTDKNGVKIFEGDIVAYNKEYGGETREKGTVYWCDGAFGVENVQDEEECGLLGALVKYQLEIIGNIHDNPGLLEGVTQ